eukprot:TRINITY_DN5406_c0_g1_i1.p1 TRINITY_DN5406_c0_g1~~TRINITY_DN5406_c0_g1_i1.p1  ORF type:complete len:352 (+),score=41.51 TRINITY_DN5406_c0_g1_i1:44-1099(+)
MSISSLSAPRGVKLSCEVCGRAATQQCTSCRVTYYCSKEHQDLDWRAVHEAICSELPPLRAAAPLAGSTEERSRRKLEAEKLQTDLADLASLAASRFLLTGDHELAVPAALQALRFRVAVHGQSSAHLVPAYLQLGEASAGLDRLAQAEEYLALARWLILKDSTVSAVLRARMHRLVGRLHQLQGRFEQASREHAHGVFWASTADGPRSPAAADAAYHLGAALYEGGDAQGALAVFTAVVRAWDEALESNRVDDAIAEAACAVMERIIQVRGALLGIESASTIAALLVHSLLLERIGDHGAAMDVAAKASDSLAAIADTEDVLATRIRTTLVRLQHLQSSTTPASGLETRG